MRALHMHVMLGNHLHVTRYYWCRILDISYTYSVVLINWNAGQTLCTLSLTVVPVLKFEFAKKGGFSCQDAVIL
jgi:hypothetical protein